MTKEKKNEELEEWIEFGSDATDGNYYDEHGLYQGPPRCIRKLKNKKNPYQGVPFSIVDCM